MVSNCPFTEQENVAPEDANSKSPEKDSSGAPKKGLKLSYEEYRHMANLMVLHMRQKEEGSEGGHLAPNLFLLMNGCTLPNLLFARVN